MGVKTPIEPATPPEGAALLTYSEAAGYLRSSVSFIYKQAASGKIIITKIGRKSFVHIDDLKLYLDHARRRIAPEAEPEPDKGSVRLKRSGMWDGNDYKPKRPKGK